MILNNRHKHKHGHINTNLTDSRKTQSTKNLTVEKLKLNQEFNRKYFIPGPKSDSERDGLQFLNPALLLWH
jgi:hypothetical protein